MNLATRLRIAFSREITSPEIASLASKGLRHPESLTHEEIRKVCASALTQAADREDDG